MSLKNLEYLNHYSINCKNINIEEQLLFSGNKGEIGNIIVKNSNNLPEWVAPPADLKGDKGDKGDTGSKGDKGDKGDNANITGPAIFSVTEPQLLGEGNYNEIDFGTTIKSNNTIITQTSSSKFQINQNGLYQVNINLFLSQPPFVDHGQLSINIFINNNAYFSNDYITADASDSSLTINPVLSLNQNDILTVQAKGIGIAQPLYTIEEISQLSFFYFS